MTFDVEWDQYPLEDYNSPRSYFDKIGRVQHLEGKKYVHEDAVEDHWMNMIDDYDIQIRDNCRLTLYLVGSALKIKIPLKVVQQGTQDVLDPLYNCDKIFDRPIMNEEIDREENAYINHRVRHIIQLKID